MAEVAETLDRSPLHDRHLAAGAKLISFAGWEMPLQYSGIRAEHAAVRERAGVFGVSHMGQIETRGPQAQQFLQHLLSNDLRRLPEGGAQYSVLCREDGGVLDDLFTYRLAESVYLTVTNAANHARDLEWFHARAEDYGVDVIDRTEQFVMLAVQGPQARAILTALSDGPPPPRLHCGERVVAGAPALICATGYTGEDGGELLLDPAQAPAVWDALLDAGVAPAGLGARDTLRLEVCYPLHGNDLMTFRGAIEAGLGWCCAEATGFIGGEAIAATRAEGPAQRLAAFVIEGPGIARQANPVIGGGVVTSGTFSPSLQRGIGMAYLPAQRAEPGTRIEIGVRGSVRDAIVVSKPIYRREPDVAEASYPDDLLYHADHDWARVDPAHPDEATFGITWYAQDSMGEVVFFDPPEIGAQVIKDSPYTEVESVKAVSDVIGPLSGEVIAVNDALADSPETINEDPYGEGWLVRVRLSDPAEQESLMDASAYESTLS